jgi:endogenous inhibitor of DNA gyrase (YacG/DUF329 family)
MTTPDKPRVVRCPACGGPSEYSPANAWRPFCCERCKNHDFGAWASESYRVADPAVPGAEADGDETPPRH